MKRSLALLLFFLALLAQFPTYSQSFDWANLITDFRGSARAHQIATDNNGDVVVFGTFFNKIKLSGGPTPVVFSNPGAYSYFLAKYDASGTLYWAKHFDTSSQPTFENQAGLTISAGNDIFVAAPFNSDLTIEGTSYPVGGGGISSFIAKFDPDGNMFSGFPILVTGPTLTVALRDIEVNSANEFYVLGNFNGDLDLGGGVTTNSIGSQDIFVARFDNTGAATSVVPIQSVEFDEGVGLELDGGPGFYVSGTFRGPINFPSIPVSINLSPNSNADDDFFVAHYTGTIFNWAKHATGAGNNVVRDMHVNVGLNAVYITGSFNDQMDIGALSVTSFGAVVQEDIFALKLFATNGNESWLVRGGGTSSDRGYGITETAGSVFITGRARGNASIGGIPISSGFITVDNTFIAALDQNDGAVQDAYSVNSDSNNSIAFDIATSVDGSQNFIAGEYNDVIVAIPDRWSTASRDFFAMATNTDLSINKVWGSYYYSLDVSDADTDNAGNIFVTGAVKGFYEEYLSSSYASFGDDDVYVAIFDNTGALLRFEFGGGPGRDVAAAIVVNKSTSEAYLTGTFEDALSIAGSNFVGNPVANAFLAKYDITGSIWGIHAINSTGLIAVNDVTTDASGNVIITGNKGFTAATFGTTINIPSTTPDFYVAKYDASGVEQWVKTALVKTGEEVTVDSNSDIIVAGVFQLATTFEGQAITPNGIEEDLFVAKYLSDGTFQWIRTGGGNDQEDVYDIKTDLNNNIYVTGTFRIEATFGTEALTGTLADVFLIKYDPLGNVMWANSGGGASSDKPDKIVVDATDNVVLVGSTRGSASFSCYSYSGLHFDDEEIFIVKYNSGGELLFGTHFGYTTTCDECNNSDRPLGLGIDASGNFYLAGQISGPITLGSSNLNGLPLATSYFLTRFTLPAGAPCPNLITIINYNPTRDALGVATDANIEIEFSESILSTTIDNSSFIVRGDQTGRMTGSFSVSGAIVSFNPDTDFKHGENIYVTLTTAIQNSIGDPLAKNTSYRFTAFAFPGPDTPNFFAQDAATEIPKTGINPRGFRVIDVDGDGDLDVSTVSSANDQLAWFENDGSQSFTEHVIFSTADFAFGFDAADLDQDGDIDFMVASELDNQFAWFENDGAENFTRVPITTGTASNARIILAQDLDGDGDIDLVTGSRVAPSLSWHENDGAQNFTEHVIPNTADDVQDIKIADIDHDGDLDIAAGFFLEDVINWYENDGIQNFTEHPVASALGNLHTLDVGDVDGDGDLDLVAAAFTSGDVFWFDNDGAQNFNQNFIINRVSSNNIRAHDMDGDNDLDILLTGLELSWLENTGAANFVEHLIDPAPGHQLALPADLDFDGDLDVISTVAGGTDKLAWYENTLAPAPDIAVFEGPNNTGVEIFDGQSAVVNIGSALQNNDINYQFTIDNVGVLNLDIANITFTGTAFSLLSTPPTTILPGNSATITVILSGSVAATFTEILTIESNDPNESPFTFTVSGTIDPLVCTLQPTVNAGADQLICPGATATLSAVLGGSATSATWSTSGSGTFDDNTSTNAVYTPSAADETSGAITLTYTVAATAVCPQVTDDVVISIAQPIVAGNPIANANVAQPSSINVIGNSTVNNGDVITVTILQNPSQGAVTINTDNTIQYVANNGTVGSDNFQYRICNQCGQCSDGSVSVSIVNEAPTYIPPAVPPRASLAQSNIVTIAIQSIIGDVNNNIDLTSVTNLSSSGNANITYDPTSGIITIDYSNASIVDPNNLSDQITFTICDQLGACSDISFNVEVEGEIIVYNGVSPNGDGLNDFLFIENIQILGQQNNVSIYNRWGDKVFEMDNYNPEDRDRRFEGRQNNGKELPSGVYFYKVEFINGRPELSGYITIKK